MIDTDLLFPTSALHSRSDRAQWQVLAAAAAAAVHRTPRGAEFSCLRLQRKKLFEIIFSAKLTLEFVNEPSNG